MATSLPTYTGDQSSLVQPTGTALTDAIIVGSKWGTGPAGTSAAVTFSFPADVAMFDTRPGVPGNYHPQEVTAGGYAAYLQGFSGLSDAAKVASREALAAWAQVANISFTEVAADSIDAGALRFAMTAPPGLSASTYGVSGFPQDIAGAGDTWMNSAFLFPEGWGRGTQNFLTLLHESGHAIGLKHPHDTGMGGEPAGWPLTPSVLDKIGDDTLVRYSTQDMVMAYNDLPGLGSPLQADYAATTPMRVDIAAIQYLYGPNLGFNATDTTYTFLSAERYNQTIWDGGGDDTIRVEGSASASINLNAGSWSQLGLPLTYSSRNDDLSVDVARPDLTDPHTVYIYDTVMIENATGGDGRDLLKGNVGANRLQGRGGNDIIHGGGGNDIVHGGGGVDTGVFEGTRSSFAVGREDAWWIVADNSGGEGVDNLIEVERLRFADLSLALDTGLNAPAGQTAQIIRALFGASFLSNPVYVGIGIDLLDKGMSYPDLVALAVGTGIFADLAGSRSNTDFVKLVYKNVVGVAPDEAALNFYQGMLDRGEYTQNSLAVLACGVEINTQSIELVGFRDAGIAFIPPSGG